MKYVIKYLFKRSCPKLGRMEVKVLKLIQEGKTKTVFQGKDGNILLRFKDDVTGDATGRADPGANSVIGVLEGKGNASLRLSKFFFEFLGRRGIPSHYIEADEANNTMLVKGAITFGDGLEFICRRKAVGSFVRRYGKYVGKGTPLDYLVEITLKDDERGDPLINEDSIRQLGLMTAEEIKYATELTKKVTKLIEHELNRYGLEFIDIKLEYGRIDDKIVLIDEISGDNMRVNKDGVGVDQKELCKIICG